MMDAEARRALLDRAITTYGVPAQMDMAVEEMAELTKALCKVKRVSCAAEAKAALENAVEEMADVQIMLDQRHRHHGVYQQARHGVCSVAGDLTINGEICRSYDPIDLCFLELNELMMKRLIESRKEDGPNGKG